MVAKTKKEDRIILMQLIIREAKINIGSMCVMLTKIWPTDQSTLVTLVLVMEGQAVIELKSNSRTAAHLLKHSTRFFSCFRNF